MMTKRIALPARPRILIVALRRLGDVLLTTPLIRSIRHAWPDATIDMLVFADTAAILDGNADINGVVTMPPSPSIGESFAVATSVLRRYDLSVSAQTGDRPTGFAFLASSQAIAPVEERFSGRLKRRLLTRSVPIDASAHRVDALLQLADVLGIPRSIEVVPPGGQLPEATPKGEFAVIHAVPMFTYKQWTVDGWRSVAAALRARGLELIATGGPAPDERDYLDRVWKGIDIVRLDGRCTWGELSRLLGRAKIYVGPDTSVTHLAAAAGCRTVAIYGPTHPRLWGPWPIGGLQEPWMAAAPIQNRGNVWIAQHAFPCTPCQLEGCERRLSSESECLKQLAPAQVILAIDQALTSNPDRGRIAHKAPSPTVSSNLE